MAGDKVLLSYRQLLILNVDSPGRRLEVEA